MPYASRSVEIPSCVGVIPATPVIVLSMIVIAITMRSVVFSIRIVIDDTVGIIGPYIINMPWPVNIMSVPEIDVSCTMGEVPIRIVMDVQSTNSNDASAAVSYLNASCLDDPSIMIIIDRNVLDLYDSTIIVILNIHVIVITRVIGDIHIGRSNGYIYSIVSSYINKIKLSIWEYRELYTLFHKDV
jgi:hypothetical protein